MLPKNGKSVTPSASPLFAVDFDGVLCDSAAETGITAWRAGGRIWRHWRGAEPPSAMLARFVSLRPVVEKGYEAILLLALIDEGRDDAAIFARFAALANQLLIAKNLAAADLTRLFGKARDAWIERDPADWISRNRFYPVVLDSLARRLTSDPVFILTTKQQRFVILLLKAAGIRLAADRIFALESALPKEDRLLKLMSRFPEHTIHFVEDRLATLLRVAAREELTAVRLYLADWGYNTVAEREQARAMDRISICRPEIFMQG